VQGLKSDKGTTSFPKAKEYQKMNISAFKVEDSEDSENLDSETAVDLESESEVELEHHSENFELDETSGSEEESDAECLDDEPEREMVSNKRSWCYSDSNSD
jgi:hypothetical protein